MEPDNPNKDFTHYQAANIHVHGDSCWPELQDKNRVLLVQDDFRPVSFACLPKGTKLGHPSVTIRVDLDYGTTVIAQTTLALLLTAADAFKAAHGDPRK